MSAPFSSAGAQSGRTRVAPSDPHAEMATLGALLQAPGRLPAVAAFIRTDDFILPHHRSIWEAIVHVDKTGVPVDQLSVASRLRDSKEIGRLPEQEVYLFKLSNCVPTAESVMHYARIVRQKSELRRVIAVASEVASRAYGADADAEELAGECMRHLEQVGAYARERGPRRVGGKVLERVLENVEGRDGKKNAVSIPTGIRVFDDKFGGWPLGGYVIVAGRPGAAKTSYVLSTLVRMALAGDAHSLFFSQEMGEQRVVEKMISFVARVEARKIKHGRLDKQEWWTINEAGKRIDAAPSPLTLDDRNDLTFELMVAEIRRWAYQVDSAAASAERARPKKVVAIDSMSLTVMETPGRDRKDDVTSMSRTLKKLAESSGITIVLIVHMSREATKDKKPRRPRLSDLRESGALEQDADVILFPWRDQDHRGAGGPVDATLIVGKFRDDVEGEVPVQWDGRYTAFYDPPDDPGV